MTEQDTNQNPESGDETKEISTQPEPSAPEAETNTAAGSKRVPGWVAPVAVGGAGIVLAVATGIGGFVAGVQVGDRMEHSWGDDHSSYGEGRELADEFRGQGKGRGDGAGSGGGRGHSHDGQRGGQPGMGMRG